MSGTKILIVEDDAKIRSGIRDNLEFDGFRVIETWNAKTASMKWRA
ncbi:MAG: DNA-binding response regulator, partial [FCB group bacterium]|nr:DNA-binding response regulator [FCB group bacterium]